MDVNDKLDTIISLLQEQGDAIESVRAELIDEIADLRESVANLNVSGRDFDVYRVEEDQ